MEVITIGSSMVYFKSGPFGFSAVTCLVGVILFVVYVDYELLGTDIYNFYDCAPVILIIAVKRSLGKIEGYRDWVGNNKTRTTPATDLGRD